MEKRFLDFDSARESGERKVDDNVGQRLGIGVAVSIGLNALVFFGLGFAKPELPKLEPGFGGFHLVQPPQKPPVENPPVEKKMDQKKVIVTQKEQTEVKRNHEEKEEIKRPEKTVEEVTHRKPQEHGPRVVITPETHPVSERHTTTPPTEQKVETPTTTGKPEPAHFTPRQAGGAAIEGNPFNAAGAARRSPEQAQAHAGSAAAAVGGSVAMMAAATQNPVSSPTRVGDLKSIGRTGGAQAYIPVTSLEIRHSEGFVVPTVSTVGAVRGAATTASPARISAETKALGTVNTMGNGGGGMAGIAAAGRTVSLGGSGRHHIYGAATGAGSGPAMRYGEAHAEVAGATGSGSANSGRNAGTTDSRHGGVAGIVGGEIGVQSGVGHAVVGEIGSGSGQRNVTGTRGTGVTGSVGDGGGVAQTTIGGSGEINYHAGTPDGTVKIGKVGGQDHPLASPGISGNGPVALTDGNAPKDQPPGKPIIKDLPPEVEEDDDPRAFQAVTQKGPKAIQKPEFELTDSLRKRKVKGLVQVRVEVSPDATASVTLIKGSGDGELDNAVLDYIRSWKWEAARQNGTPIKSGRIIRIRVN